MSRWNGNGDAVLERPEDITPNALNNIFQKNSARDQALPLVKIVHTVGKISAILSQVVELIVEFECENDKETEKNDPAPSKLWLPTRMVVKFLKPSISMTHDMYRVESNFYQHMTQSCHRHPFWIPRALYCSPTCIILEKVVDAVSYTLLESCPTDRLCKVIDHLAQFHAYHWRDSTTTSPSTCTMPSAVYSWPFPNLSRTAGMGASMSGPDKARYFLENFSEFSRHLLEQQPDLHREFEPFLSPFGQHLGESSRILDIHDTVYSFTPTLIHGDFHVGNMLFAATRMTENDDVDNEDPIWLLDWATCGQGNPLCDFVFFWVVSTRDSDSRTLIQQYLPLYYQTLMKSRKRRDEVAANGGHDPPRDLSYSECLQMARTCLMHQFILLVCYDTWTRNFLLDICNKEGDGTKYQFYERHFNNVNRRCTRAVLTDDDVGFGHH